MKKLLLAFTLAGALPSLAFAQALTSIQSVRVGYNTRKATVRPEGALKVQIDEIDQQIADATRRGAVGEMRRLMAKGMTLLNGREWTDALDFATSLAIRTETVVADSSAPYVARLEQIYSPSIVLSRALTAHVLLRERPSTPRAGETAQPGAVVKDLGTFDDVSRDLRESPYRFELDARGVADGTYQLDIEVSSDERSLGHSTLLINLRKGLTAVVTDLEAAAAHAPEGLKADILFPVDRMRNVNRGRLELRTFDPVKDLSDALAVAAAVKSGRDPFAKRSGDFKRHYLLTAANEIMPYRMYVPTTFDPAKSYPLIITLHGLGGTEDSFFTSYDQAFPPLAERHGYIVASPFGYRVDGGYGWGVGEPPADKSARRSRDFSEQDVMKVLEVVRAQYKIDPKRIYLTGHSLGAIGTWLIAPKYPDLFAAIAPFSGSGAPQTLERIKGVPEFVVHGDADPTVNVRGSRAMVARMKELGIDVTYTEVPGGNHGNVVAPNFPALFEFFNTHKKN